MYRCYENSKLSQNCFEKGSSANVGTNKKCLHICQGVTLGASECILGRRGVIGGYDKVE